MHIYTRNIFKDENGYIINAMTSSYGHSSTYHDVWILKIDDEGNILLNETYRGGGADITWSMEFGGDGEDRGYYVIKDGDHFIVAGREEINGNTDAWIAKIKDGEVRKPLLITKPMSGFIYVYNIPIPFPFIGYAIVIGDINIIAITNGNRAEFFINGKIVYEADKKPFMYRWHVDKGIYRIKIGCYGDYDAVSQQEVITIILYYSNMLIYCFYIPFCL